MPKVRRRRDGAVAILTLDDPATLNAMTPELMGDLAAAVRAETGDEAVRAMVLTGAGRGFCSGQNLKAFESLGEDLVDGATRLYLSALTAVRTCRVPVVMAVNGVAAGGGFSIAMSGDMIVAAEKHHLECALAAYEARHQPGRAEVGDEADAAEDLNEGGALNEPIPVERAREWGLVREVFRPDELMSGALQLARRLADGPTVALAATRALLDDSEHATWQAQFARELEVQSGLRSTCDATEGRAAFLEKRRARFRGR